ncbi:hypothetical protein ACFWJQ_00680 [Streptomyces goshikiensis]
MLLDLLLASPCDSQVLAPPLLCVAQFLLLFPVFGFRCAALEILQQMSQT